jgi:hypothetical protein
MKKISILMLVAVLCSSATAATISVATVDGWPSMGGEDPASTVDGDLGTRWLSDWVDQADPWLSWEFASADTLWLMDVANYAESGQDRRGMKYVDIYVKQSGVWNLWADDYKLQPQVGTCDWTDTINFGGISAEGVKFDAENNYYTASPEIPGWEWNYWLPESGTNYPAAYLDTSAITGLMEVRFDNVPEPATLFLLSLGGLLLRRRKG